MLKITATKCTGKDLKPGDLFSTAGQDYWDTFHLNHSIGERVYIRTETPSRFADDADAEIFRITIEFKEEPRYKVVEKDDHIEVIDTKSEAVENARYSKEDREQAEMDARVWNILSR